VFVEGVRLGVWGVVLVVCVCVGVLFSVGVCVCDLLIFSHEQFFLVGLTGGRIKGALHA